MLSISIANHQYWNILIIKSYDDHKQMILYLIRTILDNPLMMITIINHVQSLAFNCYLYISTRNSIITNRYLNTFVFWYIAISIYDVQLSSTKRTLLNHRSQCFHWLTKEKYVVNPPLKAPLYLGVLLDCFWSCLFCFFLGFDFFSPVFVFIISQLRPPFGKPTWKWTNHHLDCFSMVKIDV